MLRWGRMLAGLSGLGAALAAGPALAGLVVLTANLAPIGAASGSATLRVEADAELGDFCYVLVTKGLGKVKDAVIVPVGAAADAKPLIRLQVTDTTTDMCIGAERKALQDLVSTPENFTVIVRTLAAPEGAVQGNLGRGS